jgi:hypothetical protein
LDFPFTSALTKVEDGIESNDDGIITLFWNDEIAGGSLSEGFPFASKSDLTVYRKREAHGSLYKAGYRAGQE